MHDDTLQLPPALLDRMEESKAQLGHVGIILRGSLIQRYMPCGKPPCKCMADPPVLHGPYFQWSGTIGGTKKTIRLGAREAAIWQEWIDNGRRLDRILAEWEAVGLEAASLLLATRPGNQQAPSPEKPPAADTLALQLPDAQDPAHGKARNPQRRGRSDPSHGAAAREKPIES